MNPLALEFARQVLRWAGVYLMTMGLPEEFAALVQHPDVAAGLAGLIMYAVADTGWIAAKVRQIMGRK